MTGLEMRYFVLKPKGTDIYANASRIAMGKFASIIETELPELAKDLREWAMREHEEAMRIITFQNNLDTEDD